MTALEIIQAICPKLWNDANKTIYVTLATELTSADLFGSQYNYAVALRASHLFTMSKRAGSSGAVTSIQEGGLSMGFATGSSANDLDLTSYGQQLIGLMKGNGFFASVTDLDSEGGVLC